MPEFSKQEIKIYQRLNTPAKIQDFLNNLPANFEKGGKTCYSPRFVLRYKTAHCLEGAIFAAAALRLLGQKPLIVDLKTTEADTSHVIALFKIRNCFGAISKTNHAVLRYREPIYRDLRELVMSYFHEYFLDNGRKTLRSFSQPVDLSRFDRKGWMTSKKPLWYIDRYLDKVPHYSILTPSMIKNLRKAGPIEIRAGKLTQWKK